MLPVAITADGKLSLQASFLALLDDRVTLRVGREVELLHFSVPDLDGLLADVLALTDHDDRVCSWIHFELGGGLLFDRDSIEQNRVTRLL
jgi:hypothetical protein